MMKNMRVFYEKKVMFAYEQLCDISMILSM